MESDTIGEGYIEAFKGTKSYFLPWVVDSWVFGFFCELHIYVLYSLLYISCISQYEKSNLLFLKCSFQCFCSNFCYKASKFFEAQIPETPVWVREEER